MIIRELSKVLVRFAFHMALLSYLTEEDIKRIIKEKGTITVEEISDILWQNHLKLIKIEKKIEEGENARDIM